MNPGAPEPEPDWQRPHSERTTVLATVAGVAAIVLVVVFANLIGNVGPGSEPGAGPLGASATASATPTPQREVLDQLPAEEVAALGIDSRPPVGAKALAKAAEKAAAVQPYTFRISSFNVLGTQHTAPGWRRPGVRAGPDPGRVGRGPGGGVRRQRGRDAGGPGRPARRDRARHGGPVRVLPRRRARRARACPQSLMWDTTVWTLKWKSSITIPFMDTQRPQPIVRLQNIATGREIYVMNVHNSPRDAKGREWERDRAMAIEIAAIKELPQGQPAGLRHG